MKRLFTSFFLLFSFGLSQAQDLLLSEDFDYPVNDNLNKYTWKALTSATDNPIKITDGLTIKDYPAIGGAALLNKTGQDVIHSFAKISSDRIFISFQLYINSAKGECNSPLNYFMFLSSAEEPDKPLLKFASCGQDHYKAFYVMNAENKIIANMPAYIVELNHTYNFILSYDLSGDDAGLAVLNIDGDDYTFHQDEIRKNNLRIDNLSNIALCQSDKTEGSTVVVDRLRVGKTWGSVVPCRDKYTKFTSHFCSPAPNGGNTVGDNGGDRKIQLATLSSSELVGTNAATYSFSATPNYTHLSIEVPEGFLVKIGDKPAFRTGIIPLNSYYDCSVPIKIFLVGDSKKTMDNGNLVAGKSGTYSGNVVIKPAGGYCNAVMWSISGVISDPILSVSNNPIPSFSPTIFPIPTSGKINLLINDQIPQGEINISLKDNSGKLIYADTGQWERLQTGIEALLLEKTLSATHYYLTVRQGNNTKTFKLVQ